MNWKEGCRKNRLAVCDTLPDKMLGERNVEQMWQITLGIVKRLMRWLVMPIRKLCFLCRWMKDIVLGTDFYGGVSSAELGYAEGDGRNSYEPTQARTFAVLNRICSERVSAKDSILDVGCGKGLMLEYFSRFPFNRIDGVELSYNLYEIALNNIRKHGLQDRCVVYNEDVVDFDKLDDYNYFYIYNPFGGEILDSFVRSLVCSKARCCRVIYVIYSNPVCEKSFINAGFSIMEVKKTMWDIIGEWFMPGVIMLRL